jgi:hypothetical protein
MESLMTWRYFLVPEDKFDGVKYLSDQLNELRDIELTEEDNEKKEKIIDEINGLAPSLAYKTIEYRDEGTIKDGTIVEELVYRMDESPEVSKFSEGFYFKFLAYITPEELQEEFDQIDKIFYIIKSKNLLNEQFLGKSEYLSRAREIFEELNKMYQEAFNKKCGVIKTDKVEWIRTDEDEDEPEDTEQE